MRKWGSLKNFIDLIHDPHLIIESILDKEEKNQLFDDLLSPYQVEVSSETGRKVAY